MVDATDMSTPVTRGELREELAQLEIRLEQKLDQKLDQKLAERLAHLATKTELEFWGGALLARIESGEQRMIVRMDALEQRMVVRMEALEQRLLTELARHTRASSESLAAQITVIDEKYADLPPRVARLETKVFAPRRRRRPGAT